MYPWGPVSSATTKYNIFYTTAHTYIGSLSLSFIKIMWNLYAWYTAAPDINSRKCLRGPHRTSLNLYC